MFGNSGGPIDALPDDSKANKIFFHAIWIISSATPLRATKSSCIRRFQNDRQCIQNVFKILFMYLISVYVANHF
jgi:hypothetical protein